MIFSVYPFKIFNRKKEHAKIVCPAYGAKMKIIMTMIPKPPDRLSARLI